jgi:hypothetical protein
MTPKDIALWLSIISAIAIAVARFSAVEERQQAQLSAITDVRGYLTAAENRISALERDRALLERIHAIELRLGSIEEQIKERRR